MIQLFLHAIGDYLVQNDWMALNKKLRTWKGELACQIHCITYSLPFLFIASWKAVLLIYISHYIIDRFNLVGYYLAIKNNVRHKGENINGRFFKYDISNFGFGLDRPFAVAIWLYIIVDNIFHLICNYLILRYIG